MEEDEDNKLGINSNKNIIPILHEEYLSVLKSKWSSKGMLQDIRENVSNS